MLSCVPSGLAVFLTFWFSSNFISSSSNEHHLHHYSHRTYSAAHEGSGGELGDSWISDTSRDGLFASLDNDGNGKVTVEELTQYIEGTGGNSLDEQEEIQSAVSSSMSHLDDNKDNVLKKDDFSKYWSSLGLVLSVEEVADWIARSQLMPESVIQSFIDNAITGYDFPELLENDGILLETELGVTRQTIKKRLMRGMKMKLLGMGSPPPASPPPTVRLSEQTLCHTDIQIEWNAIPPADISHLDVYPVHLYRLQRQEQSQAIGGTTGLGLGLKWMTVYEGTERTCFDKVFTPPLRTPSTTSTADDDNASGLLGSNQLSTGVSTSGATISVSYRLSSWNVIGRSEYSYLKYEITRPTVSSWDDEHHLLLGREDCIEQPYSGTGTSSQLTANELQLQLLVLKNLELANSSPANSQTRHNISPSLNLQHPPSATAAATAAATDQETSPERNVWSISSFFTLILQLLWLLWVIYSTARSWLWTILSILSVPITLLYLYLRVNPPGVDPSGAPAPHWLHSPIMKPFLTALCSVLIRWSKYFSEKFPSSKPTFHSFVLLLESIPLHDSPSSSPRLTAPLTATTLRQHRILKRMNSGRSVGEDSADSQNSGEGKGKEGKGGCSGGDHCSICSKPFKLQVTFPKFKWRVKHHCYVCFNLFCSKCGVVTHANLQCPVRGSCCCQRCADALKLPHHDHRNGQQQQQHAIDGGPPTAGAGGGATGGGGGATGGGAEAGACDHCDDLSTIATSDSLEFSESSSGSLPNKKQNRSFASLKEFGIGIGKKSEKEKAHPFNFTLREEATHSTPGIPPRPSSTTKRLHWPSIPILGKRVTSSPPSLTSDRLKSSCPPSPPEISGCALSFAADGHDIYYEDLAERLST